ncbi:DNA polymerase III beta subunit [Hephaestia caeni]|uniref:Beta sliding clamp n=1 Tax=Hephaestia caeni TaxID=645617 RepID=A0A397NMA3_9SPHN|nr:DNA polymerase III subunit beta [Hephaestia caeni]RIA37498.1 DNA polymerase III beta subunit [Hephaestia caeni]
MTAKKKADGAPDAVSVEVDRDALLAALRAVGDVVEARNTIPVLANLLLAVEDGVMTVTGTDLDVEVSATLPATGAIRTTAPKDKVLAAVASFRPGALTIAPVDGRSALTIRQGRGVRTITTLPADDFPKRTAPETALRFTMPAKGLLRLFETTRIAMSNEETRYYLVGVLLHIADRKLRAAATDGLRLIRAECAAPKGASKMADIIVPAKTVTHLCKLLAKVEADVAIAVAEGLLTIDLPGIAVWSKLVDGAFPDYTRVIPAEGKNRLSVVRDALVDAAAAVTAVVNAEGDRIKHRGIAFDLAPGEEHELSARDQAGSSASEPFAATYVGEPIRFGMNSQLLTQVCGVFAEGAVLSAAIDGPGAAVRIVSDKDPDVLAVIMPMRA